MGHVAPPLAELTAHAQTLTSAGDLIAARAVLTDALDPVDADPQHATPDLADAASLLARILIALGDPHGARLWAGFAHAAGDRLYGPHDERTIAAAALHAAVLHRIGNHGRAAQLYHDLLGELAARDGPDSPRVLAAQADLATAEHAAGQCMPARARLAGVWARHRRAYGDATPAGIKMLARLGVMERECGRTAESQQHLSLVQELCARYLPADHPLAVQAAGLVSAPASGRHICGRVTDPNGTIYQQPPYLSDVHQAPGDVTGRHGRADTPPLPLPGQRAPEVGAHGRQIPIGAVEVPSPTKVAAPRLLPVPLDRPRPRGSWQPLVLVAALVAGVAVVTAVAVATRHRASGDTASSAGPAASVPAKAAQPSPTGIDAGPPPRDVRLRDNHDSLSLDWTYPLGAEGPVLISGGRTGHELRAFQQLPAGTATYVVYGLNDQLDYCFTVAVVYTVDHVAASPALCTKRR